MLDAGTGLREFFGFMAGWAGVTAQRDGLGHVFRLRAMIDQQLLTSALGRYAAALGIKPRSGVKLPGAAKIIQQAAGRLGAATSPSGTGAPGGPAAPALSQLQHTVGNATSAVSGLLAPPPAAGGDGTGGATSKPPAASSTSKLLQYLLGP
jgi:hypothetical protein